MCYLQFCVVDYSPPPNLGQGLQKNDKFFDRKEEKKKGRKEGKKDGREGKEKGGEERRKENKKGGKKRNLNVLLGTSNFV